MEANGVHAVSVPVLQQRVVQNQCAERLHLCKRSTSVQLELPTLWQQSNSLNSQKLPGCMFLHGLGIRLALGGIRQGTLPQPPTSIELAGHHFRSSVVGAATACPQELPILHQIAEPKVGNLDMVVEVQ